MRYLMTFSYDGTNFAGYQTQPGLRTVQGEIEASLAYINKGTKCNLVASGRTDAKVHALKQHAHFDMNIDVSNQKLKSAINSRTPSDIYVSKIEVVAPDFHARYMVKEKEYKYIINIGEYNPLERDYVYQYNYKLDLSAMKKAIKYFKGTHDFRAFVSENSKKDNCIRTIRKAVIKSNKLDANKLEFHFIGTGFLKYQVRNMVGYLIKVGEGKAPSREVKTVILSKDRLKAGRTAPPCGLYLMDVSYKKVKKRENKAIINISD
ncbi:MAG: tRNA pseudouridine(38-40) synthase TruA [Bacilli bacterium]